MDFVRKMSWLVLALATSCYGASWQPGTLTIYPTMTKGQTFTGNTYRDDQTGYTCYGGDSNQAPDCIQSSGLNVVEKGHSVATLATGEQFITYDYQPQMVYSIPFDDAMCFNGQPPVETTYDCTIFRQLTLWNGGFLSWNVKEPKVFSFKYKLGRQRKVGSGCTQEITILFSGLKRKSWIRHNDCK